MFGVEMFSFRDPAGFNALLMGLNTAQERDQMFDQESGGGMFGMGDYGMATISELVELAVRMAQALEVRKRLLTERGELFRRVVDAAYSRVLHKEERDVIKEPTRPFARTYDEFHTQLSRLRELLTAIQRANHTVTVAFRDE